MALRTTDYSARGDALSCVESPSLAGRRIDSVEPSANQSSSVSCIQCNEIGCKPSAELAKGHSCHVFNLQRRVSVRHHSESLLRVEQHDRVRAQLGELWRRCPRHGRGGIHSRMTTCLQPTRSLVAAIWTKGAFEIPGVSAAFTKLICDAGLASRPIGNSYGAQWTLSRNAVTCDDRTPPSQCMSASEASRTWRLAARSVIC